MMETKEKKGQKRRLLLLLLLLLLLAAAAGAWALFFRGKAPPPGPASSPSPSASAAGAESGGTVSLTYSDAVSVDLSTREVTLLFANPAKSGWDAVVRLVIGDEVAAESDKLAPGSQITTLELSADAAKRLSAGSCEGKFVVTFYDRQSGEMAALNAEIPVTVTVTGK